MILSHRYLGMAISLLFVLWFLSAFVIMYTGGMPELTESERLQHQGDLDLASVRITPRQAQALVRFPEPPVLRTVMRRPAYQFGYSSGPTVFADDGTFLRTDQVSSRRIVADFYGISPDEIERVGRIEEVDQWTLTIRNQLPLEKFILNDDGGTEVYVSSSRGQVVLETTRRDRFLAWIGAIPHWIYFTDLRANAELWSQTVIWLSGLGTLLALLGMVLVFTQWRRVRPFRLSRAIPYRGLMRWHYITGLIFGLITLTWIFSGLLSMDPFTVYDRAPLSLPASALQDGENDLGAFADLNNAEYQRALVDLAAGRQLKEIRFKRVLGTQYLELTLSDAQSSWGFTTKLADAESLRLRDTPFDPALILQQYSSDAVGYEIIATDVISSYDNYYYSRANGNYATPSLPALRLKFDDPAATWAYVDLVRGEMGYRIHRAGRVQRWFYNGLHSLNFRFWYELRPVWDIAVITLLLGGLGLCALGCYLGFRRLYRDALHWCRRKFGLHSS